MLIRGVKFLFIIGEYVFCFELDFIKVCVLYEVKVCVMNVLCLVYFIFYI